MLKRYVELTIFGICAAALASGAEPGADVGERISIMKPAKTASTNAPRESVITAKKMDYDNKEGVILCDENVVVDSDQFTLKSDRLLVFMNTTNGLNQASETNGFSQIMAIGHVNIVSPQHGSATCEKAVWTKQAGTITMTGAPKLIRSGDRAAEISGDKIVIWINDERMEVYPGRVTLPAGTFNTKQGGVDNLFP